MSYPLLVSIRRLIEEAAAPSVALHLVGPEASSLVSTLQLAEQAEPADYSGQLMVPVLLAVIEVQVSFPIVIAAYQLTSLMRSPSQAFLVSLATFSSLHQL